MASRIHPNSRKFTSSKFDRKEIENLESFSNAPIENLGIKKARCNKFILDTSKADKKDTCGCGRLEKEHKQSAFKEPKQADEKWSLNYVIEDGPTDAFGEVRFINNNDNVAKYIRVHYQTPADTITQLLNNYWHLKEPKLLISVTGGAQKFSLKQRLKDVFRRGLVKAAHSTSAWISTGGFNVGVMKHVGEAIAENSSSFGQNEKIVVLGIATWDMTLNQEILMNNGRNSGPVEYTLVSSKKDRKQPLDPNHSHFILVDNAKVSFGGEIDFRAQLEAAISKRHDPVAGDIPIVVLVLQGGVGTIKTVLESIKKGTPCVFIDRSGQCADLFAFAIRYIETKEKEYSGKNEKPKDDILITDHKFDNELRARIEKEWGKKGSEETLRQVKEIIDPKNSRLLSVFSLDSGDRVQDIDVAILTALLKSNQNYIAQLKLALNWNRVDIARDYIFNNQDTKLDSSQLDEIMYMAIVDDRVEFVDLLFQNGFNFKKFLTHRRLLKLYNHVFLDTRNKLISYLSFLKTHSENGHFNFKHIGKIIQEVSDDLYEPKFTKKPYTTVIMQTFLNETNDYGKMTSLAEKTAQGVTYEPDTDFDLNLQEKSPENELFLLSILIGKTEMAKVFLKKKREGSNSIFLCLLASKIYKQLAKIDEENAENFQKLSSEFESLAEKILTKCYYNDEEQSQLLLIRQLPEYGDLTCLQVAVSADDFTFMSNLSTQGLLTKLWYNKILPTTTRLKLYSALICPLLVPVLIEYHEDRIQRIKGFFYWLFLILFSYVALCDYYPIPNASNSTNFGLPISAFEILLIIWVVLFSFDEIRQFMETDVKVFRARVRLYFSSLWNWMEFLGIILFFTSMILRFIPNNFTVFRVGRIIFCIDLIFWYFKSMTFYTIIRNVGPKLVMIQQLLFELMYFIAIVIVFIIAFGVSTQALLYPNQVLENKLLQNVFLPAYFVIGGEYYTRDNIMAGINAGVNDQSCPSASNNLSFINDPLHFYYDSGNDCPNQEGAQATMIVYVAYVVLLDILLVNLLIAIFTNRYEEINVYADQIWKFQRHAVIYEYFHKPLLAAPLSVVSYCISLIRLPLRQIRRRFYPEIGRDGKTFGKRLFYYFSKEWRCGLVMKFNDTDTKSIEKWEDVLSEEYLQEEELEEQNTQEFKIQTALEKIEFLNEKFDQITETREDLKEKVMSCEEKIDKILELLTNLSAGAVQQHQNQPPSTPPPKSLPPAKDSGSSKHFVVHERILSPSNVKTGDEIYEKVYKRMAVLNEKSRTPHYPKSNVTRTIVTDDKVPWSVKWPDYQPVEYTSKLVLNNSNADNNVLAYPLPVRPEIEFNKIDDVCKVDRRSCLGKYNVANAVPLNPIGRTGLSGRGLLDFWGPNHSVEAIITRWKKDDKGRFVVSKSNSKILQFIKIQNIVNMKPWHFPQALFENSDATDSILFENLLTQIFDETIIESNLEKFMNLLKKGESIDKYYKDSQRNTDNAWIETNVINYHDEIGELLSKVPLRTSEDLTAKWKDFDKSIEKENSHEWEELLKIANLRHASFDIN